MALLDGKVAIITGASKGIGRALSLRFAQEKAAVVCAARSADLVRETAELVGKAGGRAIAVTCDAAKEDDVRRMIAAGLEAFGKITTLINNAGDGGPTKPVQDYTMDDWMYTIHSCLTSSYVCTRFAVPEMIKAGGGSIVNISSGAGLAISVYKNLVVFGEYRFTHVAHDFAIRDINALKATLRTDLDSHTGLVGLGARW